jgi:hypothetical protein
VILVRVGIFASDSASCGCRARLGGRRARLGGRQARLGGGGARPGGRWARPGTRVRLDLALYLECLETKRPHRG